MQNNIINQLPEMIMGEALKKALAVVPDYDASIKSKGVTERLLSLSALYDVYIPSEMSVEVYSKVYLAMHRSLREKERKLAVRQRYENHKMIRGQEHRGIIGGSDSFTVIGTSGIGKSTAVGRAITVAAGNRIIDMTDAYQKVIPCIICQCPHVDGMAYITFSRSLCIIMRAMIASFQELLKLSDEQLEALQRILNQDCRNIFRMHYTKGVLWHKSLFC